MNNIQPDDRLTSDEDLQQVLMELHYGLLDDKEAESVRDRITQEPAVAAMWAETLATADKFARAAKVHVPKPAETATDPADGPRANATPSKNGIAPAMTRKTVATQETVAAPPISENQARPVESPRGGTPTVDQAKPQSLRSRFGVWWLASLATAASIAIAIVGVRHLDEWPRSPEGRIQVAVRSVEGNEATSRNEFLVRTSEAAAEQTTGGYDASLPVVPASISYRVLSKGAVLFLGESETTSDGECRIKIPDDLALPRDAVLHIDAKPTDGGEYVKMSVPLAPTRCLTFVSTDRPVYRPGETIYFRSVTLNRRTLKAHLDVPIRFELTDPSGAIVDDASLEGITERGVGNGAFVIPKAAAGGTYVLTAKSLDEFFPDQSCEIEVRRYRAVRLKTDLEFTRRSYAAGDRVDAELSVLRADDSIPGGANVHVAAIVDETTIYQERGVLSDEGRIQIGFRLPETIRGGEGVLSIVVDDGNATETAVRPIPIHTGRAEVEFYPEGGYLVAGVSNRVYFAARDIHGEPIEIEGEILSQAGRVVANVKTVRDGLGKFAFNPEAGQRYSLRITAPRDITETPWLPSPTDNRPVMETGVGVFDAEDPVVLTIRETRRRDVLVRAVCRGELVGVQPVKLGIGETEIILPIKESAMGVIRVTVLDTKDNVATPLVERLVYRRSHRKLKIDATIDQEQRVHEPGESVRMTVKVTDENGALVPGAVLGVNVVDDTALSLRVKEIPSLSTHFKLTSEVESPEDLEHANFYLAEGAEAEESLDLLLGTQGWRRFVSGSPEQFSTSFRESLVRLLELDGVRPAIDAGETSNATVLAQQHRDYRTRLNAVWGEFWGELRAILLFIALFWLIGLLFKPERKSAVAAGLVLFAISLSVVGCSSSEYVASRALDAPEGDVAEEAAFADSAPAMQMDDAVLLEPVDAALPDADEAGASGPPAARSAEGASPLVSQIVQSFLRSKQRTVGGDASDPRSIPADKLVRWAKSRGVDSQALADQLMDEFRFPIRQYAHIHKRDDPDVRSDFAETIYWNPMMVTDSTGTASIRFDLSDSLTLFRVSVDAHGPTGRLGSGGGGVTTRLPVQIEPKLPLEVTGGDRIDLPVGLVNATGAAEAFELSLVADSALAVEKERTTLSLDPDARVTESFTLNVRPNVPLSEAKIRVAASNLDDTVGDQVERSLKIVPSGFPFQRSASGKLRGEDTVSVNFPAGSVSGSLSGALRVFPSANSQLSAGMEGMLREPNGCFEQTSASNYPNIMAYQLLKLEGNAKKAFALRAESLLRRGYRRLTSYECAGLGYEWFGNDPGHEALSAFGLMQFSEMANVIDVDREMMNRTRKWLLGRRDGSGGFRRNPRHLHSWSLGQEIVNAYLLWAISEADRAAGKQEHTERDLGSEIDALQQTASSIDDPYLMALSAITLWNVNRRQPAIELLDQLASRQSSDGSLTGKTTITRSGGISRTVETTALAILAWSASDAHRKEARAATDWLIANRRGNGFGSTQATVLALKAMIVMRDQMGTQDGGTIEVLVDGESFATLKWEGRPEKGVAWQLPESLLDRFRDTSDATLTLKTADDAAYPYTLTWSGSTLTPTSDPKCPVEVATEFSGGESMASIGNGETVEVIATVRNGGGTGQPMSVAIIGLPGGLEPVIEDLDKGRDQGQYDYYEVRGREIAFYWRDLMPEQESRLTIPCIAGVPGKYTGPPSRGYLYYTAESKQWTEPLVVTIGQ